MHVFARLVVLKPRFKIAVTSDIATWQLHSVFLSRTEAYCCQTVLERFI